MAKVHLDRAVEGLRASGQEDDLPRGLLARAAFRRGHIDRPSAEADLDEAEEIAERGQMLLHLVDVYLERTRLHLAYGENDRAHKRLDAAAELVALRVWASASGRGVLGGGSARRSLRRQTVGALTWR